MNMADYVRIQEQLQALQKRVAALEDAAKPDALAIPVDFEVPKRETLRLAKRQ